MIINETIEVVEQPETKKFLITTTIEEELTSTEYLELIKKYERLKAELETELNNVDAKVIRRKVLIGSQIGFLAAKEIELDKNKTTADTWIAEKEL